MKFTSAVAAVLFLTSGHTTASPTLNSLARDISRVESVREIKDIQRSFAQLAQFGQWSDMAALFSMNGTLQWGNETAKGRPAIERWLERDAGAMTGSDPGTLDTLVAENPLVSLSVDGRTAKGRWNGLRFMGDGMGGTRIQGGIYENEFVLTDGGWRSSVLHYYAMYAGPYVGGWRNVGDGIPIIPYHFTPEDAGVTVPAPVDEAPETDATAAELAHRIIRLNDEDEVRNLQHAYGYYVDRRMWTDVVELFVSNASLKVTGVGTFNGAADIRKALERMGPEGLTKGILNDHPIFDTIVQVRPSGKTAISRGFEIGMIGNANTQTASWEFAVFRNQFTKDNGLWKIKSMELTNLITADYASGWGNGGTGPQNTYIPPFVDINGRNAKASNLERISTNITDLQRRLGRSAAFDGAENVSAAYGYFLDDLQCKQMGTIHAKRGHKLSPFTGFYQTQERITKACEVQYGTNRSELRNSISFHWRPQSVVLVSEDGRSATLRARLLQPSTSKDKAGSFNGAIYHDQMVLEDGKWKLWSVTIDEFYWQSSSWAGGWATIVPSNTTTNSSNDSSLAKKYPPDLSLKDAGEREATFTGGRGPYITWPEIQKMWFSYRNPVSGRVPEYYWPGCVPCQTKPSWSLEANGYQEPSNGLLTGNLSWKRS